jgi:hypothetical protein
MRLVQYRQNGTRHVGVVTPDGNQVRALAGPASVYDLVQMALGRDLPLEALAGELATDLTADYSQLLADGLVLAPLDHPEPARLIVSGTGLTHTGSAAARDKMHALGKAAGAPESDSMKIFRMGIEGGKPAAGKIGVMPEWFYKGTGECVVPPGGTLPLPGYALAGGEEPEIVGLYVIDAKGAPRRIGYALGNEYSDHTTEAQNYLFLASSKLRCCSFGPELLLGDLPADVRGRSRVLRAGKVIWEDDALLGEANMSHTMANLEHHHFKYPIFRRPGDLHAHYFGAAVLSSAAGVKTLPGDEFEIEAAIFGKPLRNRLDRADDEGLVVVKRV